MRGAFLGLKEETPAAVGVGRVLPRSTLGAAASDATRAAGLADAACAVPWRAYAGVV